VSVLLMAVGALLIVMAHNRIYPKMLATLANGILRGLADN
jgi:hypothetical protein